MRLRTAAKLAAMRLLSPILYRRLPIELEPERLHEWLGVLKATRDVPGSVLEVGCHLGGTAAVSARMMARLEDHRPYVCIDTFSGFVSQQFDADIALGNTSGGRNLYAANAPSLVRSILDRHGAAHVQIVTGDIVAVSDDVLPPQVSAALIDVDLAEPVRVALDRLYPRMSPGAVILVDDCPENYRWKARCGYEAFMEDRGLQPEYLYNMGVLKR